ncbi:MAG: PfkB family carbohydrate kinase [Prochlorococcus sp.]
MNLLDPSEIPQLPKLSLAVVGHVEWMTFLRVDQLPRSGRITHAKWSLDEPAGGGAVIAVQLARLIQQPVVFYTALGRDAIGEQSYRRLQDLGLKVEVSWRDQPTRRGISLVDSDGDRAITVIGDRLQPEASNDLPWDELADFNAVFVTAADAPALHKCRKATLLLATPRVRLSNLQKAGVQLDALIGSGIDPDEQIDKEALEPKPLLRISTEGINGGECWPGGRYEAYSPSTPAIDSYGCGDSFAAGVTAGLAAGWSLEEGISLGAHCGAECSRHYGPYG